MKKILWIVPIIVLAILALAVVNNTQKKDVPVQQQSGQVSSKIFAPQTDEQGEVTVEVTPKELTAGSEVKFEVVLNTHSVALDQDLTKVSQLQDDKGNIYQPSFWDGGSGGHHLSGILTFPALPQSAKSVELKISQIGGVERTFKWNM